MQDQHLVFVGHDWAEDHHDIHVQDDDGRQLAAARLPEGVAGVARFHDRSSTPLSRW